MADFPQKSMDEWQALAGKELRGKPLDSLTWRTLEGIEVKPVYTAADLETLEHVNTLPGMVPVVRGPRATMYAARPWTVRQYSGFSTAEESNAFTAAIWRRGRKVCRSLSIWRRTVVMTVTMSAWSAMLARRGSLLIPSRI